MSLMKGGTATGHGEYSETPVSQSVQGLSPHPPQKILYGLWSKRQSFHLILQIVLPNFSFVCFVFLIFFIEACVSRAVLELSLWLSLIVLFLCGTTHGSKAILPVRGRKFRSSTHEHSFSLFYFFISKDLFLFYIMNI